MKTTKRLIIIILSFVVILTSAVSLFSWIVKPSSGIDLNVRTSELFSASTEVKLNNEPLNYGNDRFDINALTIKLSRNDIVNNTKNGVLPLNINLIIEAYKNIKVRLKLVEVWTSGDTVLAYPNSLSYNYNLVDASNIDSNGYLYYLNEFQKETSNAINFIKNVNVNTNTLPANSTLNLTVLVSVIQANRKENWTTPVHKSQNFIVNQNLTNQTLSVVFDSVSNQQYSRGVFIEFVHTNGTKYTYIWHKRSSLSNKLNLPQGTYKVYINSVDHLKFTVSRTNNNINIVISYGTQTTWGYEDVLYSPSMIPIWYSNISYPENTIVYYLDEDNNGENKGYYLSLTSNKGQHPDTASYAWRLISPYYQNNKKYEKDTVVFYEGAFYMAKVENWAEPTASWAWERLDRLFNSGNTYSLGDTTYTKTNDVVTWFYAYGDIQAHQPRPMRWQNFKVLNYIYDDVNISKYKTNEYVYHEGKYYRVLTDNAYQEPTIGQNFRSLETNYISSQTYPSKYVVTYNNNYYIALSNISNNQVPGSNANWKLINNKGNYSSLTTYQRYDSVTYNGLKYFYNGATPSTNVNPSNSLNWWTLENDWHSQNTYTKDSLVFYNQTYWTLRSGESTNQKPGESGLWQELTNRYTKTNIYFNSGSSKSYVVYNGATFIWNGAHNQTSLLEPGTYGSNWQELTDIWRNYNTYAIGDRVLYDGSYWEALQVPVKNGLPVMPGTDFMIWKEYQINWDPNRS